MIKAVMVKAAPVDRGTVLRRARSMLLHSAAILAIAAPLSAAEFETLKPWPTGRSLPPIVLDNLQMVTTNLTAFRGKPLAVHFFATWCEPCRRELPALAGLMSRHETAGFTVLAISVSEPDMRVRRFFDAMPAPFSVLLDRNRVAARSWGVDVLPTTILLDADLMPRQIVEGEFNWSSGTADDAVNALGQPLIKQGG